MSSWTYRAYDLVIRSVVEIPELQSSVTSDLPDVHILVEPVPERFDEPDYEWHQEASVGDGFLMIAGQRVLLQIDGVGRYLVEDGSRVTIHPRPGAPAHDIRVFLLGTCFGALLHQRGAFILHASGIGTPYGAVLFAGRSGAGKSTLLAEMLRRGFQMLVDDVCAITFDESEPIVAPSYPRTRLWAETAATFAIETTGLQRTRAHMDKYERQLPGQFWPDPSPLRRIYHLAGTGGDRVEFTRLSAMDGLPILIGHTYRSMMLDALGLRRHHFEMASVLARTVPVVTVTRPKEGFHAPEMAERILEDLELTVET